MDVNIIKQKSIELYLRYMLVRSVNMVNSKKDLGVVAILKVL